jgi:peptidoglycan/xylan/chitin deacetylase (PgdA/CDA1 family)
MSARKSADVLVLCYHAISEDWPTPLAVTPRAFEEQLALLAWRGYRGVTFTEAALEDHPRRTVAVTFDDGYRSVAELAAPILRRYGFPATVFVPTQYMGTDRPMSWPGIDEWIGGPHEQELLPMSWEGLRSLVADGWEIGAHTVTHPRLTTLEDAELREELVESRQECGRQIDTTCRSIAFPYGDCDDRVIEASREAGFSAVATIPWRLEQRGRFVLPRTGIFRNDGRRVFRTKISPPIRRLRGSSLSPALQPLVYRLRGVHKAPN